MIKKLKTLIFVIFIFSFLLQGCISNKKNYTSKPWIYRKITTLTEKNISGKFICNEKIIVKIKGVQRIITQSIIDFDDNSKSGLYAFKVEVDNNWYKLDTTSYEVSSLQNILTVNYKKSIYRFKFNISYNKILLTYFKFRSQNISNVDYCKKNEDCVFGNNNLYFSFIKQ